MNVEPQAVAKAVTEIFAVAGIGDDIPCGLVYAAAGNARSGCLDTGKLGTQNRVVHIFHFIAYIAHGYRAGHVRAVAIL